MKFAHWCLAVVIVGGAQSASAQQPWSVYGNIAYYYPPAHPQRPYYLNPDTVYDPPVQQVQALHGMRPPYPMMGTPANAYYAPRPQGPSPCPPGIAYGGWDLNYYAPNPNALGPSSYNLPRYGRPVTYLTVPPPPSLFHRDTCAKRRSCDDFLYYLTHPLRTRGPY